MPAGQTRDHIVEAADALFYEKGFDHTAFSDIARAVGISRGNFYYHFRTKDEILTAVIDRRLARTAETLAGWQAQAADPAGRIRRFIAMLVANREPIMRHGCPVGTMCQELAKLGHPAQPDAARLFTLFRDWLARQFAEAGRPQEADALALHLLARSQGVAALANAFHEEAFIRAEVALMEAWLTREIPPCS